MLLKICLIVLILLIPQMIRVARILHLKHLGYQYIAHNQYEEIGDKKYKWYECLR
ncbi:Uncharacterised protein [Staphylococcus intermedius NCTC 11048]|uniref:Uncharacterized protein n=1 Tax=Staphylococcus intermedius NCTC 11048 TaxID=1141106 RepID=A0A380G929_STAIN|nr:Uncharacterised protein [Staphylococcus intermedius NCTC 11048]